jgi:ADP-ribose pyrophosphatase YjhB (NUDIX family)
MSARTGAGLGRAARRNAPPRFPCARCGRLLTRLPGNRRTAIARQSRIICAHCGFMIYDYPRACAGMVVTRGEAILMLRRAHAPQRGLLDIPGGFMEATESMEAAARRELREETGLELGRVRALGYYWDRYFLKGFGWFPTLNFYYIGPWRSGVPRAADDAASAEWIALSRLGRPGQRLAWKHMRAVFRDVRRLRRARV